MRRKEQQQQQKKLCISIKAKIKIYKRELTKGL